MTIRRKQIVCGARDCFGFGVDQWRKQRQVVFGFVDRNPGVVGRRPPEPATRARLGSRRQLVEARQITFRRAQRFQTVEGRHSWASLLDVNSRVGKINSRGSGSHRQFQGYALGFDTVGLSD